MLPLSLGIVNIFISTDCQGVCYRLRNKYLPLHIFPCGSAGTESACNAGDLGLIPGLGRSLGEGKGYPLQYSGLENSVDCIVHGVAELDTTEWFSLHVSENTEMCFLLLHQNYWLLRMKHLQSKLKLHFILLKIIVHLPYWVELLCRRKKLKTFYSKIHIVFIWLYNNNNPGWRLTI